MIPPRIMNPHLLGSLVRGAGRGLRVAMVGAIPCLGLSVVGEPTNVTEVLRESLPKYDSPKSKEAPKRAWDPLHSPRPVRARPAKTESTGNVAQEKPIMLPRFMVRPTDNLPATSAQPLPRMVIRPPVKDMPPVQFETPAARDERLVTKHLSAFDRYFLNRITPFGVSKEQRARAAEAIEHSAQQMDEIAELLESGSTGRAETAEDRRAKEAYLDAYVSRPK